MSAAGGLCLGLDAGSVALKVVVTDHGGNLLEHSYTRTLGRPVETAVDVLSELLRRYPPETFDLAAGTGSAGRRICELLGIPSFNELICQAAAIRRLHPEVRTVLEMGGQDCKLIFLADEASNGQLLADFVTNTNCAAGTGSFLDQQASRLGVAIEDEFGRLALTRQSVPRVAGRCSVFAKSDMIHLQQQAATVPDILAGLCHGLVRNLRSNLARGMDIPQPVAFCGGVAANQGVVEALREVFDLGDGRLIVPACHAHTGALGVVLRALYDRKNRADGARHERSNGTLSVAPLAAYLKQPRRFPAPLAPLTAATVTPGNGAAKAGGAAPVAGQVVNAYLGLDVGSISTKAAVVDAQGRLLAKRYLMTAGRPLEAIRRVLGEVGAKLHGGVVVRGAGATGSGRYLTGDYIGADVVVNEITAQAAGAAAIDPAVDTIFEIGGQDSKYIRLVDGVVVDFEMNHACAAGTGSFLEEQAERLGVDIRGQFAELALQSRAPIRLGQRCTVFMESDLLSYQQQGAEMADLVAGLCYSIAGNYLNRVVGQRSIGRRVFFQGGTAFNRGVTAAMQNLLGRPITVPPHHEVTGAIGAALLARRRMADDQAARSRFHGFEAAQRAAEVRTFTCDACSNACEINELVSRDRGPLFYGSRCDRYNVHRQARPQSDSVDLFAERARLLKHHARLDRPLRGDRPTFGVPLALSNYQLLPFWGALLDELGVDVVASEGSTRRVIQRGVEAVLSTPCFPVKVAHGHVLELIDRGVDALWLPSVLTMPQETSRQRDNHPCPYVTALPYLVNAVLEARGLAVKVLHPPVRFQEGRRGVYESLKPLVKELGVGRRRLRQAVDEAWLAQDAFEADCRARGRETLAALTASQRGTVIVGRAYNSSDAGVCLDLPAKLRRLGMLPIPMDFLDLSEDRPHGEPLRDKMYWKSGRGILRAAEIVRDDARLHAVYLSNFGCGPDSFLIGYFKRLMAPKPFLTLEIDEHSADAGLVTRLEAFAESLRRTSTATSATPVARSGSGPASIPPMQRLSSPLASSPPVSSPPVLPSPVSSSSLPVARNGRARTVYLPWMGDYSQALAAAFRAHGLPAEVIPVADLESLDTGRRLCCGKECLPFLITAGDMVRVTRRPGFDPDHTAFFMPGGTGPCRFGQYGCAQQLLLDDLGLGGVPVLSPSQNQGFYRQWADTVGDTTKLGWAGFCAVETLLRASYALRPYERNAGQVDELYRRWSDSLYALLETRPPLGRIIALLADAQRQFADVPVEGRRDGLRIGMVGEIYVRLHDFANNQLVRQLEALGAEVLREGLPEWVFYINWARKVRARRERQVREWFVNLLHDRYQRYVQRRLAAPWTALLGSATDPPTEQLLQLARPYLDPTLLGGEAVLSVGKTVELLQHGCHGVVNVMPFSCMPSTIASSVTRSVSVAHNGAPILSISYDGQQDPTLHTRLEAFLHQAREYRDRLRRLNAQGASS